MGEGRSSDSSSEVGSRALCGVHSRSRRVLHDGPVAGEAVESLHELSANKHKDKSSVLLSSSPAAYIQNVLKKCSFFVTFDSDQI